MSRVASGGKQKANQEANKRQTKGKQKANFRVRGRKKANFCLPRLARGKSRTSAVCDMCQRSPIDVESSSSSGEWTEDGDVYEDSFEGSFDDVELCE